MIIIQFELSTFKTQNQRFQKTLNFLFFEYDVIRDVIDAQNNSNVENLDKN